MSQYTPLFKAWGAVVAPELVDLALTHRSWAFEHETESNERLEFFGDAILGYIAVQRIFTDFDSSNEGDMTKLKAASVSEKALAAVARNIDLAPYLKLGHGAELNGDRNKDSILSDAVEALIAATYLTHGLDVTRTVVEQHVVPLIEAAAKLGPASDWRTSFEQLSRANGLGHEITYDISATGPDHNREYTVVVHIGGREWGTGVARSQKMAKLAACEAGYRAMKEYLADQDAQLQRAADA